MVSFGSVTTLHLTTDQTLGIVWYRHWKLHVQRSIGQRTGGANTASSDWQAWTNQILLTLPPACHGRN